MYKIAIETEKQGFTSSVGEAVFYESLEFANSSALVDTDSQVLIKAFLYCTRTSTPPFKDLSSTPSNFVDQFMIIDQELNRIQNQKIKEQQNG